MAPMQHQNVYINLLDQQNTTMLKSRIFDPNTIPNSPYDQRDQEIINQLEHANHTKKENIKNTKDSLNYDSTTTLLQKYFAFVSYFIGNCKWK